MNAPATSPYAEVAIRAHAALAAPDGQVPSPCVQRCKINPVNGYCHGCWRNLQEITAWKNMDDATKRQTWHATMQRSSSVTD